MLCIIITLTTDTIRAVFYTLACPPVPVCIPMGQPEKSLMEGMFDYEKLNLYQCMIMCNSV